MSNEIQAIREENARLAVEAAAYRDALRNLVESVRTDGGIADEDWPELEAAAGVLACVSSAVVAYQAKLRAETAALVDKARRLVVNVGARVGNYEVAAMRRDLQELDLALAPFTRASAGQ